MTYRHYCVCRVLLVTCVCVCVCVCPRRVSACSGFLRAIMLLFNIFWLFVLLYSQMIERRFLRVGMPVNRLLDYVVSGTRKN